ncbi:MAG: NDP-sugar synthase [Acidimicrobiales bacterium]|nr:NDP-sugar synthase [Acidimicrobiales bacterium]
MDAVILVGGFGTRLRPLTLTRPKQMLPIVDRPMIEHVCARLAGQGVTRAVLSLGYRPDVFADTYPDGHCGGLELHYAVEDEPLDTAGAIRFAAEHGGVSDTFVAVNGDVLTDVDLTKVLALHRSAGAAGTLHLTPVEDPSRYGVVPIDADQRVLEFVEKPPQGMAPSKWINAGTYVLEPEVLDRIATGRKVSIEREVFPALAAEGRLFALEDDAYWIDTGTPVSYIQAQLDLVSGRRGGRWPAIADSASVHPHARLDEVVVMRRASVGADAEVIRSVVCAGAIVHPGATVIDSVVGPNATVCDRARVVGSVLGDGVEVAPGEFLEHQRRPEG